MMRDEVYYPVAMFLVFYLIIARKIVQFIMRDGVYYPVAMFLVFHLIIARKTLL